MIGLWRVNKYFYLFWNTNAIYVTTDTPLTPDKVKIKYGVNIEKNYNTDADFFKNNKTFSVVFDGESKDKIINEYGQYDFLITYDNKYYYYFSHNRFNRRHQHQYYFHFLQKDKKIYIRADIKGNWKMEFEEPMLDLSLADKYRYGIPIDSTTNKNLKNQINSDKNKYDRTTQKLQ